MIPLPNKYKFITETRTQTESLPFPQSEVSSLNNFLAFVTLARAEGLKSS